ncbi:MAG TPA: type I secretion protein [Rhodobacteraceae bacterium]|jgi:Ca2+-binding RTX toxin-like protein|nr:type I secretion protein [Paracoccaceae bacterium]
MLILAGLLGMLAIGSISLVDPGANTDETDDGISPDALTDDVTTQIGDTSTDFLSYADEDGVTQINPNETTDGDDLLIGTNAADDLIGAGGNDNVMAGGGDDTVGGGDDDDVLHGNGGDDVLTGNDGFDALFGDQGSDALDGGDGNDTLSGNDGDDALSGGKGNDSLYGGEGDDTLLGGLDNDTLVGSAGNDLLDGGEGSDLLNGGGGDDALNGWEETTERADFLNGGDGDDTIFAGADDQVSGGLGADAIVLNTNMDGPARIWDFKSGQDALVLVYEAVDVEPEVSISSDPEQADRWLIQANGTTLAEVTGDAPTLFDISFVGQG